MARLARRAHSQGELVAKLERAGFSAPEVTSALAKLRSWRYVDDRAFATAFATSAVERKLWGPARVIRALRERRLSDRHIKEALTGAFPEGENEVLTQALARFRRLQRHRGTPEQRKARAYRHLLARGFSPAAILEALTNQDVTEESETS